MGVLLGYAAFSVLRPKVALSPYSGTHTPYVIYLPAISFQITKVVCSRVWEPIPVHVL